MYFKMATSLPLLGKGRQLKLGTCLYNTQVGFSIQNFLYPTHSAKAMKTERIFSRLVRTGFYSSLCCWCWRWRCQRNWRYQHRPFSVRFGESIEIKLTLRSYHSTYLHTYQYTYPSIYLSTYQYKFLSTYLPTY